MIKNISLYLTIFGIIDLVNNVNTITITQQLQQREITG